jgi:hypothetical protein
MRDKAPLPHLCNETQPALAAGYASAVNMPPPPPVVSWAREEIDRLEQELSEATRAHAAGLTAALTLTVGRLLEALHDRPGGTVALVASDGCDGEDDDDEDLDKDEDQDDDQDDDAANACIFGRPPLRLRRAASIISADNACFFGRQPTRHGRL